MKKEKTKLKTENKKKVFKKQETEIENENEIKTERK